LAEKKEHETPGFIVQACNACDTLVNAPHRISLCEVSSMSSRAEMGRIAREALKLARGEA